MSVGKHCTCGVERLSNPAGRPGLVSSMHSRRQQERLCFCLVTTLAPWYPLHCTLGAGQLAVCALT